jgi:hypothetical protein
MPNNPGETAGPRRNYHAYLVRLWRDGDQAPWRASLTHVSSGECRHFADLPAAWAFLEAGLASPPTEPGSAGPE